VNDVISRPAGTRRRLPPAFGAWILCVLATAAIGCATARKRSPQDVALAAIKAGVPACAPGRAGALSSGVVTVRPGETLCLTVAVEEGAITPVDVVASASEATPVIVVRAWQEPGGEDVFMSIHNPLGENLKYRAGMLLPGESRHRATSSCAVIANGVGVESWPHAVTELVLADFRLIGNSPELMCE
jgi:hypothetical protein